MTGIRIQNWKRSITYHANSVEVVRSVEDIQRVITDRDRYPAPVRVKGSHHSTTRCVVAEGGTVLDMTQFNKIIEIDETSQKITMQAGVIHIDAAKELERRGFQFYVNVEIGNLTVGSGACGGTKDASYFSAQEGWEYGQVASYCVGMKAVQADGSILDVTDESDPELMAAMRSSYGMLGVIYEVTYKVKRIKAMSVRHQIFHVDEFADRLEELIAGERSMMLYLFPYLDRVVIEYRYESDRPMRPGSWVWKVRNYTWKTLWPGLARVLGTVIPVRSIRYALFNALNRLTAWVMRTFLESDDSSPADQIIRYSEMAGFASYTFSIWAFPRKEYPQTIREYFAFCKQYLRDHDYRCDLMNVGYHIAQDRRSLFSYTRRGPALTLDPVATGLGDWEEFLVAYNEFCSEHNGTPLYNQTGSLTPQQSRQAFGEEITEFQTYRLDMDPNDLFYTDHFRRMFEPI